MNKCMVLFLGFLLFCHETYAATASDIQQINRNVAQIEKTKVELNVLEIQLQLGVTEGVPPHIKYYYQSEQQKLVMLQIFVGHEAFSITHTYYFKNDWVIKYIKEYQAYQGLPRLQENNFVLYNTDAAYVKKNRPQAIVNAHKAMQLFKQNMSTIKLFSGN